MSSLKEVKENMPGRIPTGPRLCRGRCQLCHFTIWPQQLQLYLVWFRRLWACIVHEINCHDGQSPGARKPQEAVIWHISQCDKSIKSHEWLENQSSKLESEADYQFVNLAVVVKFMGPCFAYGTQLCSVCTESHELRLCSSDFMQPKEKMLTFFCFSVVII